MIIMYNYSHMHVHTYIRANSVTGLKTRKILNVSSTVSRVHALAQSAMHRRIYTVYVYLQYNWKHLLIRGVCAQQKQFRFGPFIITKVCEILAQ